MGFSRRLLAAAVAVLMMPSVASGAGSAPAVPQRAASALPGPPAGPVIDDPYLRGFAERMGRAPEGAAFQLVERHRASGAQQRDVYPFYVGPCGDVDGDGDGDVLALEEWVTEFDAGIDAVFRSGGTGAVVARVHLPRVESSFLWIRLADLTGDGALDLLVVQPIWAHVGFGIVGLSEVGATISLIDGGVGPRLRWSNSSRGTAVAAGAGSAYDGVPWTLGAADIDGDGRSEIALQTVWGADSAAAAAGRLTLDWFSPLTGERVGGFGEDVRGPAFPELYAHGDFTGDGLGDLAEVIDGLAEMTVGVRGADGDRIWSRAVPARPRFVPLRAADVFDMMLLGGVLPVGSASLSAIAGDDGTTLYSFEHPEGYNPAYVEDGDGDGGADVLVVDVGDRSIGLYSGADHRELAFVSDAFALDGAPWCCAGDLDGDGIRDVLILTGSDALFAPEAVRAFSGVDLTPLWTARLDPNGYAGFPVSIGADIDGSGTDDVWLYGTKPIEVRSGVDLQPIGTLAVDSPPLNAWMELADLGLGSEPQFLVQYLAESSYVIEARIWGAPDPAWRVAYDF